MIAVIIAGGSGTRLWPLSTPDYPKHLLTVSGDTKSLLQHTYERARRLASEVYVVSEAGHIEHVKKQLAELPADHFIVEPARRGTASCIVAALVHVAKRHDAAEPVLFSHADHFIRDTEGFVGSFTVAAETAQKHSQIVLVGVEPDYPATGFGYIEKAGALPVESVAYDVHSFKEKPDYATAQAYLKSGKYLWNAGYFVGSVNTFVRAMEQFAPDLAGNYKQLSAASDSDYQSTYLAFENVAIDYALIEKVQGLLVVPASFDWMDLGSFGDMHKAVDSDELGNHVMGNVELEGVENAFIQNYEDRPLAVVGLDDVVVVNSPNGILVARKDAAQKIGEISKRITAK